MNIAKAKKSLLRFGKYILAAVVLVCMFFAFANTYRLNHSIDEGNRKIILNYANQVAYRLHDMFERVDISLNELSSKFEETSGHLTQEELLEQLKHYDETWSMDASGLMYENGENCLSDGAPVLLESEISLRDVLSYSEKLNISRQNIDGKDMLVFAKPCRTQVGGQTVSGIFSAVKLERLEEFLGDYGYGAGSFFGGDAKRWEQYLEAGRRLALRHGQLPIRFGTDGCERAGFRFANEDAHECVYGRNHFL